MPERPKKFTGWEYWVTVSYRSVILIVLALIVMGLSVFILLQPETFNRVWAKITGANGANATPQTADFARFINLDGQVRVKKRDSVQWVGADYGTELMEGDIVQTGSKGIARIRFVDGTTYVVKPRTLIVIEQNITLENRATKVAVQLTSGAVDLSTGSWEVPGSSSQVRFENTVALMEENTRAAIRQDPETQVHEITVSEGRAAVTKGDQTIQVGPYERADFRRPDEPLQKAKVIAPPTLLRPRNLEPIISADPEREVVRFQWSPVAQARSYRLRVSPSPLFTQLVIDRRVSSARFNARGLPAGDYYWTVRAVDASNRESQENGPNHFTLFPQPASEQVFLDIQSITQHGRVIEILGRTEPLASVTINAEPVANVGPNGRFRHFTKPLPSAGVHSITIVAQNRRGAVVTRKETVYVK